MTAFRTARALSPYLIRRPVVTAAALTSVVGVGWLALFGPASEMPIRARVVGVALAIVLAWVIEDGAGLTVSASPTPVGSRRLLRLALPVSVALAGWVGACMVAWHRDHDISPAPVTIEIAALGCLVVALAARLDRADPQERSGHVAALVPFAVIFTAQYLPDWAALAPEDQPTPFDPEHRRWLVLMFIGFVVSIMACRDPARRWQRRRWR